MMRGFETEEYRARTARAQSQMAEAGLAGLLLTTEPEVRYFTGFLTRFWESPTRPWFVIVPAEGDPVAVIPSIGAPLMSQGWLRDIRTWRSPDLEDDGVSLLIDTLKEIAAGPIGVPMGHETHMRMPLADYTTLARAVDLVPDKGLMRSLRLVKSESEIAKIRTACGIADRAFDRVSEIAQVGATPADIFRRFQGLCLQEGADWVGYLAGGVGPGGYDDVISPASDMPVQTGDVLMLDTGVVYDGYYCDFDRNFSMGPASERVTEAHRRLIEAVSAAAEIARPGQTAAELFHAMDRVLTGGTGGNDAGRFGHGLGMQLTEWPSLIPDDHTEILENMVLTLEPSISVGDGRLLVHEENIVIRENGPEFLSQLAGPEIRVL